MQQFLKEESFDVDFTGDQLETNDEFSDTDSDFDYFDSDDSEFDDDFDSDESDIECEQEIMAKLEEKLRELVSGDERGLNIQRLHNCRRSSNTKVMNCKLYIQVINISHLEKSHAAFVPCLIHLY